MEVSSRQIVEVIKVPAAKNLLLQISVVPRDEQKKRHNWMEEKDWMDFYNAIEGFVKGNCYNRNSDILSGKLLRLRVKVEKIDKDAVKSLKSILGGGFEPNDVTDGLRCRIEFLKKIDVRSVGNKRSFRRTPVKETAYSKKLPKSFNILDYNPSTEKKCSCNKEDTKNSKTQFLSANEEVTAASFEEKFSNEQYQNSLIGFKCRQCFVRLINLNESNNNLGTFVSDIPVKKDYSKKWRNRFKKLDLNPIFETEYDPNSEEMEPSNIDASKDTFVVGELQNKTQKSPESEDIKMIESSIEKGDSSDNVTEMESDDVLNESQHTNKFEELNQMTPTSKQLLGRDASKNPDHSKKNVENHVFPQDTECNQTAMHNIAEKTPEKEDENKNSKKKSLHTQSQTEETSPQTIRRSQRPRVLSKRYNNEEFVVKSDKKSKKSSSAERSVTKCSIKPKQKSINVQENVKLTVSKLCKTPKSCSKALFQRTSNGSKYHSNRYIEDTWLESWTSSLLKEPLLNLNDITIDEVLETLDSIKPKLDDLFNKIYHMGYVKSYENIDHFLVIGLVPDDIQKGIMTRLSDLYETKEVPKYGSHFVNVLMPELILNIFMSRFDMNREDAIKCIKKQNTCIATMDFDDDE